MKKLQIAFAALAAAGTLSLTTPAPALADSAASTRNIILGAAALAGLAIESNVAHKNAQSRTVSGYLPDGSRVYADGHIIAPNGYSYYPQANNQRVACSNNSCYLANIADSNDRRDDGRAGYDRRNGNGQVGYNGRFPNGQFATGRNGNGQVDAGGNEAQRDHRDDGRP